MAGEEPPFLPVGTEVSAKYRGAFCEAKVKKIVKNVKCKITIKEGNIRMVVQDDDLRGTVKVGHIVDVQQEQGQFVACVVNKITDCSTYTVVFDDGDENTLRRTQLCLKGEKHFVKSDTLDELPLTHPEHFGTPVMRGARGKPKLFNQNVSSDSESDLETTDDETIPGQNPRVTEERHYSHKLLGLVVCLEIEDRKKTMWVPALVVQPSADSTELKTSDHLLVKSFRDSKFYAALQKDVKEFTRDMAMKNEDKVLKVAFEKALQYYDTHELPQTWEKDELLGSESDDHSDSSEDEEEPSEERDRFVAQLYKFMDDRGTPMNKSPQVAGQDLNLYKMFGLVHSMGGYNKVTNQMKWHVIYSKMNLPGTTSSSAANQIKAAYKKYLHAFEDFDRKLGCTMGTSTRPRARHSSGRNILSFRERDRESQPKSPRSLKKNTDAEEEETPSAKDVSDRSDVESIKGDTQRKTRSEDNKFVNSSESETDSTHSNRPMTRDKKSAKPATRESVKVTETSGRPTREEAPRRAKEEAIAIRIAKEEDRKMAKEERDTTDDKDESKQPKKRGRNRDEETAPDEKKAPISKKQKDDTSSEVSEDIKTDSDKEDEETDKNKAEYDVGVRLKIKYGRGKNMKVYEAKIIDTRIDGNSAQYKVHYAGWNTRYDEWLKKDRIVGPVAGQTLRKPTKAKANSDTASNCTPKPSAENTIKPLASHAAKSTPTASITTSRPVASIITSKTPSCVSAKSTPSASITTSKTPANITAKSTPKVTMTPTPQSVKRLITRKLINRLTPVSSDPKPAPKDKEPIVKSKTEPSKAATAATATTQKLAGPVTPKVQRPTRSTSVESNLATGLKHSKRQPKKPASVTESETQSRVSDSEESDSAEDESSEEEVKERITRSRADAEAKSPKDTTASMPESEHIKQEVLVPQKTEPTVTEKPSESIESTENTEKETQSEEEQVLAAVESAPEKMKVKVPEKVKVLEKVKVPEKVKIPEKVKVPDTTVEDQTVKEETKTDKKIDDKIYDFEDSSSQDSFKEGSSAKEAIDKGRFRRKELPKRVRKTSTDSIASNDSVTKATGSKPVVNSEPEIPKPTKEIINRSVKKSDDKPLITKTVEVEKEKKKPGPKPKEVPETPTKDTSIKGKGIQKTDKPRGKRKADAPDAPNKPDEGEKKKKVKKKKEEDTESKPSETHRVKTSSQSSSDTVSTVSSSESPEKPPEVVSLPDPSMSPPYMPAPVLMQTVSIEVKPEGSIEELAPQLSPITAAGVSTAISPSHAPVLESRDPELDPEPVAPVEPIPDTVSKDEPSSTAYVNTPPDTPVASPRGEPQVMTPEHKPEEPTPQPQPQPEPEQVPEALPPFAPPTGSSVAGGDSPTTCDTSTVSNGSGGSSGNAPGSESEDPSAGITTGDTTPNLKRTMEEEVEEEEEEEDKSPPKRRKRRQTKNTEKCYNKKSGSNKQSMSDSDEQDSLVKSPEPLTSVSVRSNTSASSSPAAHRTQTQPIQRVPKYNFLNLEDGKYLEGEERIRFLMGKITDIRKLYITLKSEVACIDRRRKRHRRKMHDAAAAAAAAAAVAAVVSRGEQEML